jgi:hypothetical protein
MITGGDARRDLARLVVPLDGSLAVTGDLFEPYRLADRAGVAVGPGGCVSAGAGGVWARGGDAAVVWDGPVALLPVLVGG